MINKVLAFNDQQQLFTPTDRVLATVSGGIDSVVLCDILQALKISFGLAHCNFGLRGEESDADEVFVRKLAKKYEVPIFVEHFSTQQYAGQEKISIQMAARALRYDWFEKIRSQQGYDLIATAHHHNDAAESILLNLTKGTGIAGFHGIPAKVGHLIRPLLSLTKDDIYAYVTERQLSWREDSSNENTKYQRNLVRQEVIPVLKKINPNLEQTLATTIQKVQGVEAIFQQYVQQVAAQVCRQEAEALYLDLGPLRAVTSLPVVLAEILKPYQFNYETVLDLVAAFSAISGKRFESATHVLVKDREQLVLTAKDLGAYGSYEIQEGEALLEHPGLKLQLQQLPAEGYQIPRGRKTAALDYGLLQFPLKVRPWKEGDWFIPLGMSGKKKVSDFLISEKVPANLKPRVLVLTSDKSIVWVMGYRPDNRFRITDKTEKILEVEIKNANPSR
jgi:tRNA(Ile)-lysidine synthase